MAGIEIEYTMTDEKIVQALEVWRDVLEEMHKQDEQWGDQRSHMALEWLPILGEEIGEVNRAVLENHFDYDGAKTDDIECELIQSIAVSVQWLISARRNARD